LVTEPLALHVRPPGARPGPPPSARGGAAPGKPAQAPAPRYSADQLARLEISLPARDLYVGELVPANLRLLIRDGLPATTVTLPTVEGAAFPVPRKDDRQPDQSETEVDGVTYHVLTFPMAISPITAGEQELRAKIEIQALVPRTRSRPRGGAFDDSFFDSFF